MYNSYVFIYVYVYIYIYIFTHIHVCMALFIYVCVYVKLCFLGLQLGPAPRSTAPASTAGGAVPRHAGGAGGAAHRQLEAHLAHRVDRTPASVP